MQLINPSEVDQISQDPPHILSWTLPAYMPEHPRTLPTYSAVQRERRVVRLKAQREGLLQLCQRFPWDHPPTTRTRAALPIGVA